MSENIKTHYTVKDIIGDYAILISESGIENQVAIFFLPDQTDIGTKLVYENMEYTVIK